MKKAPNAIDRPGDDAVAGAVPEDGSALLSPLLQGRRLHRRPRLDVETVHGVVVGELLAITDDGTVPLVRFPGQVGTAALRARTTVDLRGPHIGAPVVLMFDRGDPSLPIVLGVLKGKTGWPTDDRPAQVEVDADGERMVVSASQQLVLRCGKASITLTSAGRVLIEGSHLVSRSTGTNRIRGGSVQLN